METTNCSYSDSNNNYQELICDNSKYCCISTNLNTCSTTACSASSTSHSTISSNISPTLFWSILGGLFGTGVILIILMYIICRFRAPNSCLSERQNDADMFEEECHESHEINTVTNQPFRHHPRFYIRRESFWKTTRRKSTTNSKIVCSQCEKKPEQNHETPKDDLEMKNNIIIIKNVAQLKNAKHLNVKALPDVG